MELSSSISSILEEADKIVSTIEYDDDANSVDPTMVEGCEHPEFVFSGASDGGDDAASAAKQKPKKRTWKKPLDKPKRPLSAYNLFFQLERERIISGSDDKEVTSEDVANISLLHRQKKEKRRHRKTHGKISFADLARTIAEKWKKLDPKSKDLFNDRAAVEKERYRQEIEEWNRNFKLNGKATPKKPHVVDDGMADRTPDHTDGMGPDGRKAHPAMIDDHHNDQSLHSFMSYGQNYSRAMGGMKHNQMESDIRQTRMEHMKAMMAYNGNRNSRQANSQYMMSPMAFQDSNDYYEMADTAYSMAHMTLPIARSRSVRQQMPMSMSMKGGMSQQMQMQQQMQQQMQMQMQQQMHMMPMQQQQQQMGMMAMGPSGQMSQQKRMMNMGMRSARGAGCYYDMGDEFCSPSSGTAAGTSTQGMASAGSRDQSGSLMAQGSNPNGDDLSLDPHQGLSSPSFDNHREEPYSLVDAFDHA